ncbi:MAG: hypothetical protein ACRDC7_14455 [Aeromonas veronii]
MITDFTKLDDAMGETIKAAMEPVRTVAPMPDDLTDGMITPAVYIDLSEMEKGRKLSGGRMAMKCVFTAYCVLSSKTVRANLEVRNFAASVARVIEDQGRWGLGESVGKPTITGLSPGVFQRNGQGFECWTVEFEQEIHLGVEWKPGEEGYTDAWLAGCHDEPHYLGPIPQ